MRRGRFFSVPRSSQWSFNAFWRQGTVRKAPQSESERARRASPVRRRRRRRRVQRASELLIMMKSHRGDVEMSLGAVPDLGDWETPYDLPDDFISEALSLVDVENLISESSTIFDVDGDDGQDTLVNPIHPDISDDFDDFLSHGTVNLSWLFSERGPEEQRETDVSSSDRKRRRPKQKKTDGSPPLKRRKKKKQDILSKDTVQDTGSPTNVLSSVVAISPTPGVVQVSPTGTIVHFPVGSIPCYNTAALLPPSEGQAFHIIPAFSATQPVVKCSVVPGGPAYMLVPASPVSPITQIVPLSPAVGAVASPDTPPCLDFTLMSSTSVNRELMPSEPPDIPPIENVATPVPNIPKCVEDYIEEAKSLIAQSCQHMEKDMRMESHYIDVRLVQRTILMKSGKNANKCLEKELVILSDVERRKATLSRSQMFEDAQMNRKQVIALLGKSGTGKSTLIRHLCLDWASGSLPRFHFVFSINCRTLDMTCSRYSLKSLLFHLPTSVPCQDSEAVFKHVLAAPKNVLIIFDSFDDFKDHEGILHSPATCNTEGNYSIRQLFSGLFQKHLLPGCMILIATRPKGALNQLLRKVDSILELCDFSAAEIELYTSKYFKDHLQGARALSKLKQQRFIFSLCSNPLLCRSACFLLDHLDSAGYVLPSTLTGLCQEVLSQCLQLTLQKLADKKQDISRLCCLAWERLKAHSSLLTDEQLSSEKLRDFGLLSDILTAHAAGTARAKNEVSYSFSHLLGQNFLSALHVVLSKDVSEKALVAQTMQPQKRKKPHGEWLDTMQQFTVGLLYQKGELLDSSFISPTADIEVKRSAVESHVYSLKPAEMAPARLLELCHSVYESQTKKLSKHLAKNLPSALSLCGTQLTPQDAYVLWDLLQHAEELRKSFFLDLQDTGIPISSLKDLVGLACVRSFRAAILDTVGLWEELHNCEEEELLKSAVDKFTIQPFKATQEGHINSLVMLIHIHRNRKLPSSDSVPLEQDIPAVKELEKLDFELGPSNGPLVFPKLAGVLPALENLKSLDLENNKIGDSGVEILAGALFALSSLKRLNLSQNTIGDKGMVKLAPALPALHSLQCLSLYNNQIADNGAEKLASVLPEIKSLLDLDVGFNNLTDTGAVKLSQSLKSCPWMKTLGMWNQCIPFGIFKHLHQQDSRIKQP
ncbi:MHC class II transactivator isoform X2 [Denticeps clupeoides]|uniref:MHC class II transactivator isoform X2 n=1 Tax=Denticeps clupeoides TaxID=299321 RepID=UPI0010A41032|nr:MHC class II transactivator isoform X2 [Denticeps clupeoides]